MPNLSTWLATGPLGLIARPAYQRLEQWTWRMRGRNGPTPHRLKESVVRTFARTYGLTTLVETGTYLGDMVAAVRGDFATIHTIELDQALYERATRRFAGDARVHLHQGDSGKVLAQIVEELDCPALFWLDAHHSGGVTALGDQPTPVLRELDTVLATGEKGNVMLIDDARDFTGRGGYPSIATLKQQLGSRPYSLEVRDDIVRIVPAASV